MRRQAVARLHKPLLPLVFLRLFVALFLFDFFCLTAMLPLLLMLEVCMELVLVLAEARVAAVRGKRPSVAIQGFVHVLLANGTLFQHLRYGSEATRGSGFVAVLLLLLLLRLLLRLLLASTCRRAKGCVCGLCCGCSRRCCLSQ